MAMVFGDVLTVTYTVVDDDGAKSTVTFYATLPSITSWTSDSMERVATEMESLVSAISDGAILGVTMSLSGYDDAFPAATAGSDVENKGVFLLTAEGNQKASLAVPSIMESKLVSTGVLAGIQLDVSDGDVLAFVDALESGIDLNPFGILDTVTFGTSRGEAFQVVRDAYKQNRASFKSRGGRG